MIGLDSKARSVDDEESISGNRDTDCDVKQPDLVNPGLWCSHSLTFFLTILDIRITGA